ncbi:MAG: OmpL47-type beta-barrel domain-containing protein, partial [Thermoleophilia bacterium]
SAFNAEGNWWGSASGPGAGSAVSANVDYSPWLEATPGTIPMIWGTNSSIQGAIDAASPGDSINVAAGTYSEAVTVNKSVHLTGAGIVSTIIQAPPTLPVASDINSVVVTVVGSGVNAEISGFTIAGPGPSGCGSIKAAIFVRGSADANIHNNRIADARDNPFSGCQNGLGIIVGRQADATTGTATIANNEIVSYQKGGVLVDGAGSNAAITGNTVTGAGTTTVIAQNGIQISRGATATLTGNTVTGNSFHIPGNTWDWGATGVLLYQSGAVTLAGGNNISGNDSALYIQDPTGPTGAGAEIFGASTAPLDWGYYVVNLSPYALDLTQSTFEGVAPLTASPAAVLPIKARIWDGIDQAGLGVTALKAGNQFVTHSGSIQRAIAAASPGDTVNVEAATYVEPGQLVINKDISIAGADKTTTIIKPGTDTSGTGDSGSWFLVNNDVTFNLSHVTLDGAGRQIRQGVRYNGSGTVDDTIIENMVQTGYMGFAICQGYTNVSPRTLNVTNSTFTNFGRVGIQADDGGGGSTLNVSGSTITGKGDGDHLDYGITVEGGAHANITGNTITNCRGVASVDGSTSGAIEASTYFAPGTSATITGNTLTGNTYGLNIGWDSTDTSAIQAHHNNISGNSDYGVYTTSASVPVHAEANWWGAANGPGVVGPGSGDKVSTNVIYLPWLSSSDLTGPAVAYVAPTGTIHVGNPTVTATAVAGASPLTSAKVNLSAPDPANPMDFFTYTFDCTVGIGGDVSCPTTGLRLGNYTATVTVLDGANKMADSTGNFSITDTTPPVTTDNAPAAWQKTDVTVALSCVDDFSGCASTTWSADNGGPSGTGTGPIVITNEGVTTITYHSVDGVLPTGNVEGDKTATVRIDKTAPTTTDNAPAGWQMADFSVALSCGDGTLSGCASTSYTVDGGAPQSGTSVAINTTGDHTIVYHSTDVAGNTEGDHTVHAKLDKVAPSITYTGPTGTVYTLVSSITATASDADSGLQTATLSLNGAPGTACTITGGSVDCPVTLASNGVYSSVITVSDVAGNTNTASGSFDYEAHGKPDLSVAVTRIYWASYADYVVNELSVDYRLNNNSVGITAMGTHIDGAISTMGVLLMTATPAPVGDIPAASSGNVTLKYSIPGGVTQFKTRLYAEAADPAGTAYLYPGPYGS